MVERHPSINTFDSSPRNLLVNFVVDAWLGVLLLYSVGLDAIICKQAVA